MGQHRGSGTPSGKEGRREGDVRSSAAKLARWVPEDESPRTRRLLRLGAPLDGDSSDWLARRYYRRGPLVFYRGESWRVSSDGSLKRWDVAAHRWESIRKGQWSSDDVTFVDEPEGELPQDPAALKTRADDWSSVQGCTYVGGTLDQLCVYGKYAIAFGRVAITMLSHQAGVVEIPCDEVVGVEIEGRGRVDEATAGRERFAFERAIDEMAATAVVRSLVTRAGMDTSIRIATTKGEGYFHCDCATPDEVRAPLAPFLAAIRRRRGDGAARDDVSGELAKLANLRTRGLLTDDEFATGVAGLLGTQR